MGHILISSCPEPVVITNLTFKTLASQVKFELNESSMSVVIDLFETKLKAKNVLAFIRFFSTDSCLFELSRASDWLKIFYYFTTILLHSSKLILKIITNDETFY